MCSLLGTGSLRPMMHHSHKCKAQAEAGLTWRGPLPNQRPTSMDSWPDMLRRSSRLQSSSPVLTNLHRQLQSHVLIIVGSDFPQHWRHIFGEYSAVCMSVTHLLRTLIAAVSLTRRCRQENG